MNRRKLLKTLVLSSIIPSTLIANNKSDDISYIILSCPERNICSFFKTNQEYINSMTEDEFDKIFSKLCEKFTYDSRDCKFEMISRSKTPCITNENSKDYTLDVSYIVRAELDKRINPYI